MAFAIIFESVGVGEWFVLLAVILVVVGPKRLPSTARKFGQYYSKFRRAADSFKRQLLDMDTEFNRAVSEAENAADETLKDVGIETGDETPAVNYDDPGPGPDYYENLYNGEPAETPAEPAAPAETAAAPAESAAAPAESAAAPAESATPPPNAEA